MSLSLGRTAGLSLAEQCLPLQISKTLLGFLGPRLQSEKHILIVTQYNKVQYLPTHQFLEPWLVFRFVSRTSVTSQYICTSPRKVPKGRLIFNWRTSSWQSASQHTIPMPLSWSGLTGGSLSGIVSRAAAAEAEGGDAEVEAEEEYRRLDVCFQEVQEQDARNTKKDGKRMLVRAIWRCYKADFKKCAYLKLGWSVCTLTAIAYFVRRCACQLHPFDCTDFPNFLLHVSHTEPY